jgi:TRAP-type C4-dicarboxylate transport system substrate-binding protein
MLMMKRFLLLAALGLLCASGAHAASTVVLGTLAPEGTTYHRTLLELREAWRKVPGGGVNLRIYGGGKLGGESKMVSQMRLGALDAALLTGAGLAEIEKSVTGLQTAPMIFRSLDEVDHVGKKLQPMLQERMEKAGFVVLFWSDAGWVRYFSKQPMRTPDDLKKFKLFTWAGDAAMVQIWKTAGYQPVPLETSDIVPMLDTGLINCVPAPPFVALAAQIYDRAPHMLELNWAPLTGALVIRKAAWDKLPAAAKPDLLKTAAEAGKANKAQGRAESDKAVQAMKSKGLTVHPVSPELEAQWRTAAEAMYPYIQGKFVSVEMFDEVQKVLKEYRATQGSAKP